MNKEQLANEVGDILNLPRWGRRGKAWDIMNAILQSIVNGLRRGETIRIDGFGTFRVAEHPSRLTTFYFYPHMGKGRHKELVRIPSKKYVRFEPARNIKRTLNGGNDC